MRVLRLAVIMTAFLAGGAPAPAQDLMRIVGIVNGDVISAFDLDSRIAIALYSTNLPDTPDMRARLAGPVLRNLIDETLQVQEATRQGIRVREGDMERAMAEIAAKIGAPPGQLEPFLAGVGIPLSAVENQLTAQIAWGKFVNQRLRPSMDISEDEITGELERLEASRGMPEYLVSEIDLYPDPQTGEAALMATAFELVGRLRDGADFAAVAAQFSQGSLARNAGDMGWVRQSQSRPEIEAVLAGLRVGDISDPIATFDGVHILYLRDKRRVLERDDREVEVFLTQILLPSAADEPAAMAAERLATAQAIATGVEGCDALRARAASVETGLSGDLGWVRLGDLPVALHEAVAELPVGTASAPLTTAAGAHVLMVCERNEPDAETDIRDTIYDQIALRRLSILERRVIRNLRQSAFLELRQANPR